MSCGIMLGSRRAPRLRGKPPETMSRKEKSAQSARPVNNCGEAELTFAALDPPWHASYQSLS